MQKKLFDIKPIRIERPNISTSNMGEAYLRLALILIEWDSENFPENELEEIVSQLKDAITIEEIYSSDAYQLTRLLEDFGDCAADINLCEKLKKMRYICNGIIEKEIKNWVVDCEITPKFSAGDQVKVKIKNDEYFGEISSVDKSIARYYIFIEEGNSIVCNFENIEYDFFSDKHWK